MELLRGSLEAPVIQDPSSILARREGSLINRSCAILESLPHHRDPRVNRLILPQCQAIIEAIGYRLAYEAAVAKGLPSYLIDLFTVSVMKYDLAWYSENAGISSEDFIGMEDTALEGVLPHVDRLIKDMNVMPYVRAPIVSDERWEEFVNGLETFVSRPHGGSGPTSCMVEARL